MTRNHNRHAPVIEIEFNDHVLLAKMVDLNQSGLFWYWWTVDRFTGEETITKADQEQAERYALGLK